MYDKKEFEKFVIVIYKLFINYIKFGQNEAYNRFVKDNENKDKTYINFIKYSLEVIVQAFGPDVVELILNAKLKEICCTNSKLNFKEIILLETSKYILIQLYVGYYNNLIDALKAFNRMNPVENTVIHLCIIKMKTYAKSYTLIELASTNSKDI